ncbi:MAG: hypothetical protein EBU23_07520 [Mycobacteriaceae bacterium]|nr:hypothetical protein [Mycobacteriaceae bacterium]
MIFIIVWDDANTDRLAAAVAYTAAHPCRAVMLAHAGLLDAGLGVGAIRKLFAPDTLEWVLAPPAGAGGPLAGGASEICRAADAAAFAALPRPAVCAAGAPGRFGNQFIRHLFVSALAQRCDLRAAYSHGAELARLGLPLYTGARWFAAAPAATTEAEVLAWVTGAAPFPDTCVDVRNDNCYCQSRPCSLWLHAHLKTRAAAVRAANPFRGRYLGNSGSARDPAAPTPFKNSDVFVHVRLDDAAQWSPGFEYYARAVRRAAADFAAADQSAAAAPSSLAVFANTADTAVTGWVSSDSPAHETCQRLLAEFPGLAVWSDPDVVRTIQFASTCRAVVLSHGSFSATIGNLAFDSLVYYPPYPAAPAQMWFGDMFTMPGWVCVTAPEAPPVAPLKISLGGVGGCALAEALRGADQPSYPYDWLITAQSFIEESFNDMNGFFDFAEELVYDTTKLLTRRRNAIMLHDFADFQAQRAGVIAKYTRRFARLDAALRGPHPILFVRGADDLGAPLSPRNYYDQIFVREAEDVGRWSALMVATSARYNKRCELLYVCADAGGLHSHSHSHVTVRALPDPKNVAALQALIAEVALSVHK